MVENTYRYKRLAQAANAIKSVAGYCLSSILHKDMRLGMPVSASIEPANYCNLHCPQCPTGLGLIDKKPLLLHLDDFKRTIDSLSPELIYLNLYFQGEPMLNDNVPEMVEYASAHGIFTSISTNGHFLSHDVCHRLKKAGLGKLIVSLDGADEESYKRYRCGGNFNKVIEGIRNAVSTGLKVELQCLLLKSTENQIDEVRRIGRRLGVWKMTFKTAQFYTKDELMPSNEELSRYKKGTLLIKRRLKNRCWRTASGIVITTDGEVLPCCYDKDCSHSYGNLFKAGNTKEALRRILQSGKASDFISSVFKNRVCNKICTNCTE